MLVAPCWKAPRRKRRVQQESSKRKKEGACVSLPPSLSPSFLSVLSCLSFFSRRLRVSRCRTMHLGTPCAYLTPETAPPFARACHVQKTYICMCVREMKSYGSPFFLIQQVVVVVSSDAVVGNSLATQAIWRSLMKIFPKIEKCFSKVSCGFEISFCSRQCSKSVPEVPPNMSQAFPKHVPKE